MNSVMASERIVPVRTHYVSLDSLRGIGALMIVLYHSNINSSIYGLSFFKNLYLFVDFFFVLSGFVIAANYQYRLTSINSIKGFVRRRFWRLYPLHFAVLCAFVFLELAELLVFDGILGGVGGNSFTGDRSVWSIFTNLLLIHSLGIHESLTWNYPSWSISTEFYSYIIFAVVAFVAKGKTSKWALAAILISPIVIYKFSDNAMYTTWDFGLVRCVYGFSAGVLIWNLLNRYSKEKRFNSGYFSLNTALEILAIVFIVILIAFSDPVSAILAPFVFFPAVLVFTSDNGLVSWLLSKKAFVMVGIWSYSIYMIHFLIRDIEFGIFRILRKFGYDFFSRVNGELLIGLDNTWGNVFLFMFVLATIGLATFTYKFIEMPGREFGRKSNIRDLSIIANRTTQL